MLVGRFDGKLDFVVSVCWCSNFAEVVNFNMVPSTFSNKVDVRLQESKRLRDRICLFFFYLGVGLLFSHELDAVVQSEWRLLYVLRDLPDERAMQVFVWLHVPLFGLIAWLTHHGASSVRLWSRVVLSMFLIVHAGLHFRLSTSPLYTFDSALSVVLIYGAALAGLTYLVCIKWSASPNDA